MDRETKEIEIGNHKLVVKTYATALEASEIQNAYFKGTKVEMVGDKPKFTDINANVDFDVKKEMIRQLVVSIDGKESDEALRIITEVLPLEEYQVVIEHLDELTSKKKKSQTQ